MASGRGVRAAALAMACGLFLVGAPASRAALPSCAIERQQTNPFPGGGLVPAYKLGAGVAGTETREADLVFDAATEPGAAVQKLLGVVGKDPLAAYRWVRDNVEFEPYGGIKRGAEGVAWERAGNDFDQAALLASVLRSQGYPVRFVHGVVRVSAETLADWAGTANAEAAYLLFVHGGTPIRVVRVSGLIEFAEVNHLWLETRVPYTNPGAQGPGEPVWIPLAPAFKGHKVEPGTDLFPALGFQEEEFLSDFLELSGDPSPEEAFRDLLRNRLTDQGKDPSLAPLLNRITVRPGGEGALPLALPPALEVRGVVWEEAAIPDAYHNRVRITISDMQNDGAGVTAGDVHVTLPTAFLSGHFLTVVHRPATPEDQALADGSPSGSPLDPTIRKDIRLVPVLLADGKPLDPARYGDFTVAAPPPPPLDSPTPGNIAVEQTLKVETIFAGQSDPLYPAVESDIVVGEAYALGFMVGTVTAERMENLAQRLRGQQATASVTEVLSTTLSLTALQYLHEDSLATDNLARLLGMRYFIAPSLVLCGVKLDRTSGAMNSQGVFFDIQQHWMALVPRDGRDDRRRAFQFLSQLQGSYLEHKVLERVFRTTAVSAVRILRRARELGLTLNILDADTLEGTLGTLPFSTDQKNEIRAEVMSGAKLYIPPIRLPLERWNGWGYILWNPENGSGGYFISGGMAGGSFSGTTPSFMVGLWVMEDPAKNRFTVVHSAWVDPETGQVYLEVTLVDTDTLTGCFLANVIIVPKGYPLPEEITFDGTVIPWSIGSDYSDLQSDWYGFPATFHVPDSVELEAMGFCLLPGKPDSLTTHFLVPESDEAPADAAYPTQKVDALAWDRVSGSGSLIGTSHNPVSFAGPSAAEGDLITLDAVSSYGGTSFDYRGWARLKPATTQDTDLLWDFQISPGTIGLAESATLSYTLTEDAIVNLEVRDLVGDVVRKMSVFREGGFYDEVLEGALGSGTNRVALKAVAYASGAYDSESGTFFVIGECPVAPLSQVTAEPSVTAYPAGTVVSFSIAPGYEDSRVALLDRATRTELASEEGLAPGLHGFVWDGAANRVPLLGTWDLLLQFENGDCSFETRDPLVVTLSALPQDADLIRDLEAPDLFRGGDLATISFFLGAAASGRIELLDSKLGTTILQEFANRSGTTMFTVSVPAGMAGGIGQLRVIAYTYGEGGAAGTFDMEGRQVLVLTRLAVNRGAPFLYPAGKIESGDELRWPAAIFAATEAGGGDTVESALVEVLDSGNDVIESRALEVSGRQPQLEAFEPGLDYAGGWYTIRVTLSNESGGNYWQGSVMGMVGANKVADGLIRLNPGWFPQYGWLLAPLNNVKGLVGLNTSSAVTFLTEDSVRVGLLLSLDGGLSATTYNAAVAEVNGDPFNWFWDGYVFNPANGIYQKPLSYPAGTIGDMDPACCPPTEACVYGDSPMNLSVVAVNDWGDYQSFSFPIRGESGSGTVDVVRNVAYEPWSVRIEPSDRYQDGVIPFDPVKVRFRAGVSGKLQLYMLDSGGTVVKTFFKDSSGVATPMPVPAGDLVFEWDLRGDPVQPGDPTYLVPDGTYHLKAALQPFQDDHAAPIEVVDSRASLRVNFNTRRFHEIGKERGRGFYGGVDVTSGNRYLEVDDISLPMNRYGFKWTRYYNSKDSGSGALGTGWRHNFQIRLVPYHGGSRRLSWGDGRSELFTWSGGSFVPEAKSLNRLSESGDGWVVETPEGFFKFDELGYITEAVPWDLKFGYRDVPEGKLLDRVSNIVGAGLELFSLDYDGDNLLRTVTARVGGVTQQVRYLYRDKPHSTPANGEDKYLWQADNRFCEGADYCYVYTYDHLAPSDYLYPDETRLGDQVLKIGTLFHYAMTRSEGPAEGVSSYEYGNETEEQYGQDDQILISSVPVVEAVDHLGFGADHRLARGRTTYDFAGTTLTTVSALGTEVVVHDARELTVLSRNDARPDNIPRPYVTTMEWDQWHRLTRSVDPEGVSTRKDYVESGADRTDRVEASYFGTAAADRAARNGLVESEYRADGSLKSSTDALGNVTSYEYEYSFPLSQIGATGLGTKVTITDPDLHETYRYQDADGRVLREVNPLGKAWDMAYDLRGNLTSRTDPRNQTTRYYYDAWDRMIREETDYTMGGSGTYVMHYEYDGVGNRVKSRDAKGNETTYTYDGGNRLVKEKDRFGKVIREHARSATTGWVDSTWERNADRQASPLLNRTLFAYFDNGWVRTEETSPASGVTYTTTYLEYDRRGNLLRKRDPRDKEWVNAYDAAGRLETSTDPTGRAEKYEYFDDGDRRATYYRSGGAWVLRARYETNEAGWVVTESRPYLDTGEPRTTTFVYDARGNRTKSIDPLGNATTYHYRDENLLAWEMDSFGQYRRILTYNPLGLVETEKDYYGRTSRSIYDGNYRLQSHWDAHHVATTYAYDDLSRVKSETRAGLTTAFGYDESGNRTSVTDGNNHVRRFVYDDANRQLQEYVELDPVSGYTATPGLPTTGRVLGTLAYDDAGRVATERDADGFPVAIAYYGTGWPRRKTFADGSYEEYEYNDAGVRTRMYRTNGAGTGVLETVYTVNSANQVTAVLHPDLRFEAYAYTAANEVLSHTDRDGVTDWYAYADLDQPHRVTSQWRQVTSSIDPVDCVVGSIPVDPAASPARGVLLAVKDYNAAGDVVGEANSSQAARGVATAYIYSGSPGNAYDGTAVLLEKKTDPVGRESRYTYVPGADRVQTELLVLPAGSGYETRPGHIVLDPDNASALKLADYSYDGAGNVISVLDGDGRRTSFAYDELNRRKAQWLPGAGDTQADPARSWTYDGRGNVASETLHGINDLNLATTKHQYDLRGRKTLTLYPDATPGTDADNPREEWGFDLAGNQLRHKDPDGRIARNAYDPLDRPWMSIQVLAPGSRTTAPADRIVTLDDEQRQGIVILENHYVDAAAPAPTSYVDWSKDGRGIVTSFAYDVHYRLVAKSLPYAARAPDGSTTAKTALWSYAYDALGKPAVETDPNLRATATEHDAEGRERRTLRVLDASTTYVAPNVPAALLSQTIYGSTGFLYAQTEYDAMGRKIREVDGRGIESSAVFDVLDRVKSQSRAGIVTAQNRYEAGGNKLWSVGAVAGYDRTYTYDARGFLATETAYPGKNYPSNPLVVRTASSDRQGNVLWEKDAGSPAQNEVRFTYDPRGRKSEQRVVTDGGRELKTVIGYDNAGNKISESSPLGRVTTWAYDEFGKLALATAPDGGFTAYVYDPNGNLLRIEDAEFGVSDSDGSGGHFSTFGYDELNNRVAADRDAGGGRVIGEKSGYDGASNLLWKKDGAGRLVSYAYDEFNRVRDEIRGLPASPAADIDYLTGIAHLYDGNGNAISTTETLQTSGSASHDRIVSRAFDDFDRMISETADARTTGWAYDNDGRRASMTYPDGRALAYEYDGLGNLSRMTDSAGSKVTRYDRYANGLPSMIRHANWTTETWGYKQGTKEANSLLVKDSAAAALRTASYAYDDDGNRTGETDARPGQPTIDRTSTYDAAGRLETVMEGSRVTTYGYDRLGNRTHEAVVEASTTVTDLTAVFNGAGEVTAIDGTKGGAAYSASFTYDLAGNLSARTETGSAARSMKYDHAGQMVEVSAAGAPLGKYLYNSEGRRTIVKEGAIARAYVYDGRSLLLEYSAGSLERRYLYADRLVGLATTASYAVHLDPLGSTLEVTDDLGRRYSSNAYDPWGDVETVGQPSPSKLLYTGHQQDAATGLIYFGARYYDPALARFLSADPYEGDTNTPPSLNKYLYAYANPYRWVDLEGYLSEYWLDYLEVPEDRRNGYQATLSDLSGIMAKYQEMQAADAEAQRAMEESGEGNAAFHGQVEGLDPESANDVRLASQGQYQVVTNHGKGDIFQVVIEESDHAVVGQGRDGQPIYGHGFVESKRIAGHGGLVETHPEEKLFLVASIGAAGLKLTRAAVDGVLARRAAAGAVDEAASITGATGLKAFEKGRLGSEWSQAAAQARGEEIVGKEVDLIFTIGGKRVTVRADVLTRAENENVYVYVESKFSPSASYTRNQGEVIPGLVRAGDSGLVAEVGSRSGLLMPGAKIRVVFQGDVWNSGPTLLGH